MPIIWLLNHPGIGQRRTPPEDYVTSRVGLKAHPKFWKAIQKVCSYRNIDIAGAILLIPLATCATLGLNAVLAESRDKAFIALVFTVLAVSIIAFVLVETMVASLPIVPIGALVKWSTISVLMVQCLVTMAIRIVSNHIVTALSCIVTATGHISDTIRRGYRERRSWSTTAGLCTDRQLSGRMSGFCHWWPSYREDQTISIVFCVRFSADGGYLYCSCNILEKYVQ